MRRALSHWNMYRVFGGKESFESEIGKELKALRRMGCSFEIREDGGEGGSGEGEQSGGTTDMEERSRKRDRSNRRGLLEGAAGDDSLAGDSLAAGGRGGEKWERDPRLPSWNRCGWSWNMCGWELVHAGCKKCTWVTLSSKAAPYDLQLLPVLLWELQHADQGECGSIKASVN